jgi:ATP-dependent Clp protease ATP-binding subunit ClpA
LGILDKGTLTLGDNRKVDFSASMIFMTSNLGAAEMSSLLSPRMGFQGPCPEDPRSDAKLGARISECGIAAARRKFTPEFINRLDSMVVFKSLGEQELRNILDIELQMVYGRIQAAAGNKPFVLNVADSARRHLLREGTDFRYGARHLKRAIERLLVQPLSNLIASDQIRRSDRIHVTHAHGLSFLTFSREARALEAMESAERVAA